jgi:chemotaxis protein MotB
MKTKSNGLYLLSFLALSFLSSCVSQKKYQAALNRESELQAEVGRLNSSLKDANTRVDTLQSKVGQLSRQWDDAKKNAASLASMANLTQQQLEAERKRLADMRSVVEEQRQVTENLRKKMADALVGFNSNELSVFTKNGKVYVSLQENLLFPSGSAVVNPKGKEALGKLAQVLNTNPDISIMIEGHTDSIPIKGRYEDNWALSVARATAIVRILANTYKVEPERISASGRSKYEPVDSNETAEGRAKNRRTEIILAPKLDELMKLLEQAPPDATTGM